MTTNAQCLSSHIRHDGANGQTGESSLRPNVDLGDWHSPQVSTEQTLIRQGVRVSAFQALYPRQATCCAKPNQQPTSTDFTQCVKSAYQQCINHTHVCEFITLHTSRLRVWLNYLNRPLRIGPSTLRVLTRNGSG